MTNEAHKPPGFSARGKRTVLLGAACFFLLLFLLTAAWVHHALQPVNKKGENQNFVVEEGATLKQVAVDLENADIIRNSTLFRLAGRLMGHDHHIKTGEYRLNGATPALEILETLKEGRIITHPITIPEGFSLDQIAQLLEQKGFSDKASFLEQARDRSLVTRLGLSGDTLEGYLYPDTYRFRQKEKVSRIITVMVKRFRDIVTPLEAQIKDSGMTLTQVITLASIVEKETGCPEERPMIARVFLNRLKKNMRLESDPTVIYGISHFNGNLTKKDLRTQTAYNTYMIRGLPPAPIANPGLAAISAVLNPAEGNDYYFVSKNNGTHYFSGTLKEHNRAVRQFQKNRSKRTRVKSLDIAQ
ncbi:MAG: endolytic transglycosylase MltG [Deltaproteobacteria bacterium]|nr:endolytic transglycosylase MltG [Deltaproteobacteria bacterium]